MIRIGLVLLSGVGGHPTVILAVKLEAKEESRRSPNKAKTPFLEVQRIEQHQGRVLH